MQLLPDKVFVLNDARAGQEGERILLDIPADKRVFFEIGGTGEGSQYDIPGFDEAGHRIIADSIHRKFLYIAGEKLGDYINPDGSFKVLDRHQRYAEHIVAGPWTGIRFVKDLEDNAPAMSALAKWILEARKERLKKTNGEGAPEKPVTHEELLTQLDGIADLQSGDRHRWAVDSNAPFIKEINGLILNPDLRMVLRYLPCDLQLGPLEARNPERAMRVRAWSRYKLHLKERGQIAGKIYREMHKQGVPPDYFILGGGLGEMFNKYPQEQREDAIREITDAGKLPPGLFNFSQVSPEARESAISHRTVKQTQLEWERLRTLKDPNITGDF